MNDKNQWPDIQSHTRSLQKLPKMKKKIISHCCKCFCFKKNQKSALSPTRKCSRSSRKENVDELSMGILKMCGVI